MYNKFKFIKSKILPEISVIEPSFFQDVRGVLYTDYLQTEFNKYLNQKLEFKHSKYANSFKNVLRGIHGDFKTHKLIQCVYGKVFQVVVDCRKDSNTYLKYDKFILDGNKPLIIHVPPGFGNAFLVQSDYAVYNYKLAYFGDYNDYDKQFTFKWNDKKIDIKWPTINPILSKRDE